VEIFFTLGGKQDKTRQDGEEVSSNLTSCECSISIVAHARNMG